MVRAFLVVSEGRTRPGRINGLGLAGLNDLGGLWGLGAVPDCPVLGPGMMRAGA